jgi:hypothetical protein
VAEVLAIFAVAALALGTGASPAGAGGLPRRACTITGTRAHDWLVGTSHADVICGRGANDRIRGRGGADALCPGDRGGTS